jgi:hypothetical protein
MALDPTFAFVGVRVALHSGVRVALHSTLYMLYLDCDEV